MSVDLVVARAMVMLVGAVLSTSVVVLMGVVMFVPMLMGMR